MIVVDTGAVIEALAADPPHDALLARLRADDELHALHLIDVEFLHALRGLVQRGEIGLERAIDARSDFADLLILRYPHPALADRMWALRHNLSAYDAAFIALSEALDMPLVTVDSRLARAPGHSANVEVFERD